MVRTGRLELPHLAALEPKSSVSTNSTTSAPGSKAVRRGAHYTGMRASRVESEAESVLAHAGLHGFYILLQTENGLVHLQAIGVNGFHGLLNPGQALGDTPGH